MTREEAAKILYQEKSNAGWMRWVGFPVDIKKEQDYKRFILAVDVALDALRGPQPDTDCGGKMRIDIPPGNDSVRATTGFQRDGGDKTERRCNQCVICGQEMSEGDQVCGYCRRQYEY